MNLEDLKKPFPEKDIEWRIQKSGVRGDKPWALVLAYVDARAVQDRLDDVCGPENWKTSYNHHDDGIICNLSIKIKDEWVTKQDGSPQTKIEAFKGGISKALVRAASCWGIGRYLYGLSTNFAFFSEDFAKHPRAKRSQIGENWYTWVPPELPMNFLTEEEKKSRRAKQNRSTKGNAEQREFKEVRSRLLALCQELEIDPKTQLKEMIQFEFPQFDFTDLKLHEYTDIISFLERQKEEDLSA